KERKISRSCGTSPTPKRERFQTGHRVISTPPSLTEPPEQTVWPMMVRSNVVFPTPLRPSSARHSPAPTFSDRSSRTTVGPYPAVTRSNARSLAIGHLPLAKIDGTYVLVARDLLGRAMGHHPASLEHGDF